MSSASRRSSRGGSSVAVAVQPDPFEFEPTSPPPPTRARASAAGTSARGRRAATASSVASVAASDPDGASAAAAAAASSTSATAVAAPSSSRGRRSAAASSTPVVSAAYTADRARLAQQALMAAQARSLQQMIQRGSDLNKRNPHSSAAKPSANKQQPQAANKSNNKRGRSATRAAAASSSDSDGGDPSSSSSESDIADSRPKAKRSLMASLVTPKKGSNSSKKKTTQRGRRSAVHSDDSDSDVEEVQPPRKKTRRAASPASSSSSSEDEEETSSSRRGGRPARTAKAASAVSASGSKPAPAAKGRKRATILDEPEEEEQEKDDVCAICQDGGILIVCEQCVHAYHQGCLEERHPDNYEFLKELGEDDPLACRDVHQTCTARTETRKVQKWDEMEYVRSTDATDVRLRAKWVGAPTHRAGRKKFYRAFQRDVDVYAIGSHVVLQAPSPGPGQPTFLVAEIESLWEDMDTHEKMVECRWLYLPEETRTGRLPHHAADEVFETGHCDDNEVAAIEDLCDVVDQAEYERRIKEDEERGLGEADRAQARKLFFVRQRYDDDRGEFRPVVRGRAARAGAAQKDRAVNPRQSLLSLAGPSGAKAKGDKAQSIYSQACAQLQLSAAPPKLPCRDKERADILRFIENGIKRGTADGGLYIAGVPGTGKTATVVRVISELAARSDLTAFEYVEINGMKLPEPHQLYTALWKALTGKHASPAKAAVYLDQRFRTTNPRRPLCVLLVDELDFIMTRQQNVIYNLFDWPGRKSARLIVIGISNTIDLPDMLMPRVHSRLGLTKLHFEPYSTAQIQEIIADRLRALPAFGEGAIELCARKIASISGDIRRALQICRRAAEICEEDQLRITAMEKVAARQTKGKGAAASAAAAATASAPQLIIGESHIVRAIGDLQNSSFIQWLRVRAQRLPLEPVLLCAMLACIKFAAGPARPGSAVMAAGGDENPVVPLDALASQAATLMDVKGVRKLVADRAGVRVELMPLPTLADWSRLVQQWGDLKLVQLSYTRGDRFPAVQLNVLAEDIEHAYRGDDMWDRLRSQ